MFEFLKGKQDKRVKPKRRQAQMRNFNAAGVNRLTSDWTNTIQTGDSALRMGLKSLRARSRQLADNNDYARKFFNTVKCNVIGGRGIRLQVRSKDANGKFDKKANRLIEEGWLDWGKKVNSPTTDGRMSWVDAQRLFIESVGRDGEVIIRMVPGYPNKYGFSIQILEADHLDEEFNTTLSNGNFIKMGIEFNQWNKPVAYHLLREHPGDQIFSQKRFSANLYERIPAEQIIHAFIVTRPSQSRGLPWMHTAMMRLHMLGGYEEAELVAARVGASKMGFFTSPDGTSYNGQDEEDGAMIMEADPGTFEQLPEGMEVTTFDPQHPNSGFEAFEKAILRGVASGLNVSYNSLASNLEGVNFSSIRHGTLEERDNWRDLQAWVAEHLCDVVFTQWLTMAMTVRAIPLPIAKFDKFNKPLWRGRGWMWIDPLKENQANALAIEKKMKSRTQVADEQGVDIEELFEQIAAEEEIAARLGLKLTLEEAEPAPPADEEEPEEQQPESEAENEPEEETEQAE